MLGTLSSLLIYFLESDELDLGGSFYVGGLDYMDPNLSLPTSIWSASLKLGYVGCLKDLVINGADIDVVAYTHEQNSGEKMHKIDIYSSGLKLICFLTLYIPWDLLNM